MANKKDETHGMRKKAKETRKKVDETLKDREVELLRITNVDLESVRPQIADDASFNKLIEAVNEATQRNEKLADLKKHIIDLGEEVIRVAKEIAGIIK